MSTGSDCSTDPAKSADCWISSGKGDHSRQRDDLLESLPHLLWCGTGHDGALSFGNQQFRAFFGRQASRFDVWTERAHPEDRALAAVTWLAATSNAARCSLEVRLTSTAEQHRWHRLTICLLDAETDQWMATAIDIEDLVASRHALEERTELLQLAQSAAGTAVWHWDIVSGRVELAAASAVMHWLLPVADDEMSSVTITVQEWEACVHPEDLPMLWRAVERALETRTTFTMQFRTLDRSGSGGYRWVQSLGRAIDEKGTPARMLGLHLDVTEQHAIEDRLRLSEQQLKRNEERLKLALDSGQDGLWDYNIECNELWVSPRVRDLFARIGHFADITIESWMEIIHADDRERLRTAARDHLVGATATFSCEYRMPRQDGSFAWYLSRGRVVARDKGGRALRVVGTLIDISLSKETEQRISHMAHHDDLTGLANRVLLRERLDAALTDLQAGGGRCAVLACDLDRFKSVNDSLGHAAGDQLLRIVAERLLSTVRAEDTVARVGGDEFAVLLFKLQNEDQAQHIAARIIEAIGEPLILDGREINIGISLGITVASCPDDDAAELLKRADMALYESKLAGRNAFRMYDSTTRRRYTDRSVMALAMKEAIRRGDFFLVYQPVIDLNTGAVSSFEALMRWQHPTHGIISPTDFIPIAEETNLIIPLGAWALREACREARAWPDDIRVAVNVSPVQFKSDLPTAIEQALRDTGLPASRLKIEVTESVFVADPEAAVAMLNRLRVMGVRLALDDFGTGYSSLNYLRRFPFDKIKIDRAFTSEVADASTAAIVQAIIAIGTALGIGVVAEGIETVEQLEEMKQIGCEEAQGFLFSKPIAPAEIESFLVCRPVAKAA